MGYEGDEIMAVKDVREYYEQVTNQYVEMKRVLNELETVPELKASAAYQNIDSIKAQVAKLQENYNRLSYIIFLLNEPTKKSKKERYIKREQKKLSKIPKEDRKDAVLEENKNILTNLSSYI